MSYQSALDTLYQLQRFGIKLGLETTTALLTSLDDPHQHFKSVQIAGTNGKGSTAAILASILTATGHRTGLYTSPHLIDFSERIQVNGHPIPHERLEALIDQINTSCPDSVTPTFFEFATAIAFRYFADVKTEIGIVEVGMGGRFDSTNVIQPLVTIITNVELDHQKYLGDTIESIAAEKCGIIRTDVPTVVGNVSPQALPVIQNACSEQRSPLVRLGVDFEAPESSPSRFDFHGPRSSYSDLQCSLMGHHQVENAACALAAVEWLRDTGMTISEDGLRTGLMSVQWPGRLECIAKHPTVFLDGAHNPAAAASLADFLIEHQSVHSGKVILVIGMQKDKDMTSFFTPLVPLAHAVILARSAHTQSASAEELAEQLPGRPMQLAYAASAEEAMMKAHSAATREDTICVTGSLLLVGEVKAHVEGASFSPLRG
ncbi:MAG TPA: bifunctional folylpolyglutamate synthase/dihydrofolate synthase [Nitrospirales bacterium]|nr:bifunctional folylpolyglutamate synthase/dihydrofolate synthase [Nitrospirales bacterium]